MFFPAMFTRGLRDPGIWQRSPGEGEEGQDSKF